MVLKSFIKQVCLSGNVESDGKVLTQARDPPGQRSSYILPGNPVRETYRIVTFQKFPSNVPVHPCSLASSGFFYTGYKDRVKCFSCGICVENWQLNDDPTDSRWHRDECKFVNGNDLRNVPLGSPIRISSSVMNIKSAIAGSSRSPSTSRFTPASSTPALPSCSTPEQRPQFNSVPARNEVSAIRVATFPCLHPINPHMRARESRLQTFLDHMPSWPAHRISATQQEIAEAGMYFLGERDRVKCWYCNGELQNWEREDSPWEEHAKWFPQCEFVLQQKGPEFVDSIVARFPDIRRPVLHNLASYSTRNESRPSTSSTSSPQSSRFNSVPSRNEGSRLQIQLDNMAAWPGRNIFATPQEFAKAGYYYFGEGDRTKSWYCNGRLQNWQKDYSHWEEHTNPIDPHMDNRQMLESRTKVKKATSDVEEELRQLEDERTCKSCGDLPVAVVFLPCGHLACCLECGERLRRCPICKKVAREKIKAKFK